MPTPPPLPPIAFPGPGSRNIRYALSYTQGANLADAPLSTAAYVMTWRTFSGNDVAALKSALGLTGPVLAAGDTYTVSGPGTLSVNNTLGVIRFTAPSAAVVQTFASPTVTTGTPAPATVPAPTGTTAPAAATSAPQPNATAPRPSPTAATPPPPTATATSVRRVDDATALALAQNWLAKAGLLPSGIGEGRVTRPASDQIVVTFHPQSPGALVLADPQIQVILGLDGSVREMYHRWPTAATPRAALLRSASEAWADALAGNGYLEVNQTIPATVPNNTVFQGNANVTQVSLGWALASGNGTDYLVPVFVFEGTATLTTPIPGQQPTPLPFRLYVTATP